MPSPEEREMPPPDGISSLEPSREEIDRRVDMLTREVERFQKSTVNLSGDT